MKEFLLALQFLTIIPLGSTEVFEEKKLLRAPAFFPLVGLLIGLILAGMNNILSWLSVEQFLSNAVLLVLLIVLTGGLHLDGLADTFDALGSGKDRARRLEIMRDSHIGTMGVLSLISLLLLKLALLCSLVPVLTNNSLILMCLLSRYALILAMFLFPYARQEGKAKLFMQGMNYKVFFLGSGLSLAFSLIFFQLQGVIFFILVTIFVFLAGKYAANKIGGITGDVLGAISELTEIFVLCNVLILSKF
ncbi:MAG: adenosylcobinamide-GDP ribazoletransferase [Elusimicrobiota bacterium]